MSGDASQQSGTRVVLATRNAHKVVELQAILREAAPGVVLVGLDDPSLPATEDVVESGVTFAANALLKARAACAATGLPALADDSGIAVDVLGGSPGVFSARWAGRHGDDVANLDLLLAQLADVPDEHRAAAFECAAALVMPDGREEVHHGRLPGLLTRAPRGANGFGYDPVLQPEGSERTCAELTSEEKNATSHRSRAFRSLAAVLPDALAGARRQP